MVPLLKACKELLNTLHENLLRGIAFLNWDSRVVQGTSHFRLLSQDFGFGFGVHGGLGDLRIWVGVRTYAALATRARTLVVSSGVHRRAGIAH